MPRSVYLESKYWLDLIWIKLQHILTSNVSKTEAWSSAFHRNMDSKGTPRQFIK